MSRTILVVDDEISVRQMIGRILEKAGYDVVAASSGEEAIELTSDRSFDVVVTDIHMRGMSGQELVAKLRESRDTFNAVYISGYTRKQLGLEDDLRYLEKPFTPDELLREVAASLEEINSES